MLTMQPKLRQAGIGSLTVSKGIKQIVQLEALAMFHLRLPGTAYLTVYQQLGMLKKILVPSNLAAAGVSQPMQNGQAQMAVGLHGTTPGTPALNSMLQDRWQLQMVR
jgi:hypothetical protein